MAKKYFYIVCAAFVFSVSSVFALSATFGVEEEQQKGVSRKPKKLAEILNNLLTKLTLDVFESHQRRTYEQGKI